MEGGGEVGGALEGGGEFGGGPEGGRLCLDCSRFGAGIEGGADMGVAGLPSSSSELCINASASASGIS